MFRSRTAQGVEQKGSYQVRAHQGSNLRPLPFMLFSAACSLQALYNTNNIKTNTFSTQHTTVGNNKGGVGGVPLDTPTFTFVAWCMDKISCPPPSAGHEAGRSAGRQVNSGELAGTG
jgi:hypothetical protein